MKLFQLEAETGDDATPEEIDRLLNCNLCALYLNGESRQATSLRYAAVKWHYNLNPCHLRHSQKAKMGHARREPRPPRVPETWEAVLLQCVALLTIAPPSVSAVEQALAAVGFLWSFDLYGRSQDLVSARKMELRPPLPGQAGRAGAWALTLFPETTGARSKTGLGDLTNIIGDTCDERKWLAQLAPLVKSFQPDDPRLLCLTPKRYADLFHLSRRLAGLDKSCLHRLRHGGVSADALKNLPDHVLQDRGFWKQASSVQTYRQSAMYLRALQKLTVKQLTEARVAPSFILKTVRQNLKTSRMCVRQLA